MANSLDKIKKPIFHSKFKVYILIRKGNKKNKGKKIKKKNIYNKDKE